MCAGGAGGGAMGSGMGQQAGFQPWMGNTSPGLGGGMSQQAPWQSWSGGMGGGQPQQRQSPWMGSGGLPPQAMAPKVDKFYTPGAPAPLPMQGQMDKVDRFSGLGGAPMPTGDVFAQQQGPMDLQNSALQRAMSGYQQSFGQQGQGQQGPMQNPNFQQLMAALQGMGNRQV